MNTLGDRNYALLEIGIKESGSFAPEDAMEVCGEQFYTDEWDEIEQFLRWVDADEDNRAFGSGNYEQRFAEFKDQL